MKQAQQITVLISGSGSLLPALIKEQKHYKITQVISNCPNAMGLELAKQANLKTKICDHQAFAQRDIFEQKLQQLIKQDHTDWIILAGFMRRLGSTFCDTFKNKIINIHPSLLPKYPGLNTYKRALDAKDTYHGCTIHFVNHLLDGGPIIAQSRTAITDDDTIERLKSKTQQIEQQLYPWAINQLCRGAITIKQGRTVYNHEMIESPGIEVMTLHGCKITDLS